MDCHLQAHVVVSPAPINTRIIRQTSSKSSSSISFIAIHCFNETRHTNRGEQCASKKAYRIDYLQVKLQPYLAQPDYSSKHRCDSPHKVHNLMRGSGPVWRSLVSSRQALVE